MKVAAWTGLLACVTTALAVSVGSARASQADAFWAAASAPSSLYTPLSGDADEPVPTAWCEGQGNPSCAPAAPATPHQPVSFARAQMAVLNELRLPLRAGTDTLRAAAHEPDGRPGVRWRVERPPQA